MVDLDFSNPLQTLTTGNNTVTSDGYLIGSVRTPVSGISSAVIITINNTPILNHYGAASYYISPLKVKAGDVINIPGGLSTGLSLSILGERA